MAHISVNSSRPSFNIFALLAACLGFPKNEATFYSTELPDSLHRSETQSQPHMIYPGISDRPSCKESKIQTQSNRPSDMNLRGHEMLPYRKKSDRILPYNLTSGKPEGEVIKVLSVDYERCALSTANLQILAEHKGKVTMGWFSYEEIQAHHGTRKAVESFNPTWW